RLLLLLVRLSVIRYYTFALLQLCFLLSEDKPVGDVSFLTHVLLSAQVEFQDQSQLILKHSEIHQLDQELPKRVRARLAIPVPQEEVSSADEAKAAKRRRLPSVSAPMAETSVEMTNTPACSLTTAPVGAQAAEDHSIHTLPTSLPVSQPTTAPTDGIQMDAETPMDMSVALTDALTESTLASDPTLTPQSTPFSVDVSYMETLLHSHFTQDSSQGPMY
ncbi:uncharacterized protein LOC116378579, partial [Anarrhichthys ocellatus]|uniref:uncharacterized protein LOC116378579 n=1 Tax=Anarrhichthys ocellatus TaxID=433405 RepID=UPI0012ECDEC4